AADDHRLEFGMIDVRRDDGAAARNFIAHELGRDFLGNVRAEGLAAMLAEITGLRVGLAQFIQAARLADGDEFHLRRDDAAARVVHLRDVHAALRHARLADVFEAKPGELCILHAAAAVLWTWAIELAGVVALDDPGLAHRRVPAAQIGARLRVGIRAGTA